VWPIRAAPGGPEAAAHVDGNERRFREVDLTGSGPAEDLTARRPPPAVLGISAVTLATHDMGRAVRFYEALGLAVQHGGETSAFTSFALGRGHLNLIAADPGQVWAWWGRVILYVEDVDAFHRRAVARDLRPQARPENAPWGERFFHITDPDGHELSFAEPLGRAAAST
jgi:catechol 2,3-dioxygenase-like lactoylglutathione lyase family enzyme